MTLLIKICGLSTPDTLAAAIDAGADMVGFVFFAPSPRNLSMEQARALGAQAQGKTLKVALSVDADDAFIDAMIEAARPDLLQLHGQETPERVQGDPRIGRARPCGLRALRGRSLTADLRRPPAQRRSFARRQRRGV